LILKSLNPPRTLIAFLPNGRHSSAYDCGNLAWARFPQLEQIADKNGRRRSDRRRPFAGSVSVRFQSGQLTEGHCFFQGFCAAMY
jgi:hypothetical protein